MVNYGVESDTSGWRISWSLIAVGAVPLAAASAFLPDTVPSLADRRRPLAEAVAALTKLRGRRAGVAKIQTEAEAEYAAAVHDRCGLGWLRTVVLYRVQILLCFLLGTFRALTGNPLLLFYGTEVRPASQGLHTPALMAHAGRPASRPCHVPPETASPRAGLPNYGLF